MKDLKETLFKAAQHKNSPGRGRRRNKMKRNIRCEALACMKRLGVTPVEGPILNARVFPDGYELEVLFASGNELEEAVYYYSVNTSSREVLVSHCGTAAGSISTEWERIA